MTLGCQIFYKVKILVYFQGALFVLLGNNKNNIAMKRSWEVSTLIWPAIVQSQHSEKPSILKVIDDIVRKVVKNVESAAIEIKVSPNKLKIYYESQFSLH